MATWNVINLSELENFKDFSSEYYRADNIQKSNVIRKIGTIRAGNAGFITDGEHGSPCWSETSGIKYITAEFIKENYIEQGDFKQITKEQDKKNARARLQVGDVLVYSVGAYAGLAAVAEPHLFPANIPRSVAIIRLNKKENLNAEYVSAFINSKYGKFQTFRLRAGNSQPVLALDKIRQIEIPVIEEQFQKEIQSYYQDSYKQRLLSQSLYRQAEALLTKELQLDKLQLPKNKWYTAQYSEVVDDGRMDSEYFSPVVKKTLEADFLKGSFTIGGLFYIVRGYTPKSYYTMGVPMVKTKSVRTPVIDKKRIEDYANSNESLTLTQENDLILAAMGVGSLGRTSFITQDDSGVAIDGTLRIFRKKDENLKYVEIPTMLFLSTEIGQKLIYRGIVGSTGIISVTDDYLAKIPVPMVDEPIRKKLTELVLKSINNPKPFLPVPRRELRNL